MDLKAIREMLRALKNRLEVQIPAMRDPSGKADAKEFLTDVEIQIAAVSAAITSQESVTLTGVDILEIFVGASAIDTLMRSAPDTCDCDICKARRRLEAAMVRDYDPRN